MSRAVLSGEGQMSSSNDTAANVNRPSATVAITTFDSMTSTIGQRVPSVSFATVAEKLTTPQDAAPDQTKDTLPMLSFAEFVGDKRNKENVIRVHALVLDVDNEHSVETGDRDEKDITRRALRKEPLPIERRVTPEALLRLFDGSEACVYSSWSHGPELTKFRLVMPFSRAVTPAEWERVTRWARSLVGKADLLVDPASWSAAHAWYRPRRREGRDFIGIFREGHPLDVDAILRQVPEEKTTEPRTRWSGTRFAAYQDELQAAVSMPALCNTLGLDVSNGYANLRGERTSSAKVYDDHIHDFGSNETFYPVTLVAHVKKLNYRQAVDWLAEHAKMDRFDWSTAALPAKVDPTEAINALPAELPSIGWAAVIKPAIAAIATQDSTDVRHWADVLVGRYGAECPAKTEDVLKLVRAHVAEAKKARKEATAAVEVTTPEYTTDESGWLCQFVTSQFGTAIKPIANFKASIERVTTYADELKPRTVYVITGRLSTGETLPTIEVDGAEFEDMRWVLARWSGKAFFAKDRAAVASVRDYILRTSRHTVETVHTTLGWFDAGNGRWGYRHAKGVIGAGVTARVQVQGERLNAYAFPDVPDDDAKWISANGWTCTRNVGKVPPGLHDAIRRSLALLDIARPEVTYAPYAATVGSVAPGLDVPRHMVALIAPSKSRKTSLALQLARHFGDAFRCEQDLPLNYQGTSVPAAQYVLACAANALVIVDDARPRTSQRETEGQKALIEFLARRQARDKATRDGTPRPTRTPRASVISTWELDFAPVEDGESTSARIIKVRFSKGEIDDAKLGTVQQLGRHAYAMRAYIEWLASNYALAHVNNAGFYKNAVDEFRADDAVDDRQPDDLAHLLTGFRSFLLFAFDVGVITEAELKQRMATCREALVNVARQQTSETRSSSHEERYIAQVSTALRSGRFRLVDVDSKLIGGDIGWVDDRHVYLDPDATQSVLVQLAREQGEAAPLPKREIYGRLVHAGIASPPTEKDRIGTKRPVGGGRPRVIEIARSVFEDVLPGDKSKHREAANDPEIISQADKVGAVTPVLPDGEHEATLDSAEFTESLDLLLVQVSNDNGVLSQPFMAGPERALAYRAHVGSRVRVIVRDGSIVLLERLGELVYAAAE